MTSNANVTSTVGFASKTTNNDLLTKEILNRLDEVIEFQSVNKEVAKQYINLKNKDLDEETILTKSNYQKYGFRELDRTIKSLEVSKIK